MFINFSMLRTINKLLRHYLLTEIIINYIQHVCIFNLSQDNHTQSYDQVCHELDLFTTSGIFKLF
jgi:hypothetical protein